MKKFISFLLVFVFCFSFTSVAFAEASPKIVVSQEIEQIDDSSYAIITLYKTTIAARAGSYTQNGAKNYTYVQNGTVQWTFTVYGVFNVNPGVSCSCTNSAYGFDTSVSGWSLSSADSSHSGSTATAWGTVTGPKTVSPRVSVSCDSNGNLT